MSSKNKIRWTYTDDGGTDYAIAATKAITDQVNGSSQVKVGGSAAAVTVPRLPPHIKPRYVYCTNSGVSRKVIAYDTTCDLWVTGGTTITLEKSGSDVAFTRDADGRRGERTRNTCKQSA